MWLIFLFAALIGILILLVHINLELNSLDKVVNELMEALRKHYGTEESSSSDQTAGT
ncbi:MAG: hypothetical protein GF401_00295 [Chitinivibrionales bacterium]|nr:hypothetical protein [Chitinivibrionales bacterium]